MIDRALEYSARVIDFGCYAAILLLAVWLPIPYGSKPTWSIHLLQVVVFGTLLLWAFGKLLKPSMPTVSWRPLGPILALMLIWLLYQLFQATPLPFSLVKVLSPGAYDLYQAASGERQIATHAISLDRYNTLQEATKYSTYVALFVLVFALVHTRMRLLTLAYTLFLVGFFQSVFGLYALFTDTIPVDREVLEGHRWVSGTFLNRNHFAGHLLLTTGVGLGLLLSSHDPVRPWRGMRNIVFNLADLLLRPNGWIFICLVVLLSALFLSESRGGVLSLIASLLIVWFLVRSRDQKTHRASRLAVTAGAAMLLAGIWFGVGTLMSRFHEMGNDERIEQWKLTAEMTADYPVVGIGGGNYQWVFPRYRNGNLRLRTYDHAHSDYLETLVEQGIVGTAILGLAIGVVFFKLVKVYQPETSSFTKNAATGVLVSITGLLVHAAMDFNFRIPANAAYFYIIAALGMSAMAMDRKLKHPA